MTNEEAIEKLKYAHFHFRNEINEVEMKSVAGTDELEEFNIAINSIQENTKLKAENESLKVELEQSAKFPCKVKDVLYGIALGEISEHEVYAINIGMAENGNICEIWTRNYRNASIVYELIDFGKTIFLTREEAEQSLKNNF